MGELESRYWTGLGKRLQEIVPFDEAVNSIKTHVVRVEQRNEYLEKENKRLKDEHYKDAIVNEMKEQLEKAEAALYRGFPIDEKEWEAVKNWQKKHDEEKHGANYEKGKYRYSGAIGGNYTYQFTPTSIGTVGTCICSCGEKFDFQELG